MFVNASVWMVAVVGPLGAVVWARLGMAMGLPTLIRACVVGKVSPAVGEYQTLARKVPLVARFGAGACNVPILGSGIVPPIVRDLIFEGGGFPACKVRQGPVERQATISHCGSGLSCSKEWLRCDSYKQRYPQVCLTPFWFGCSDRPYRVGCRSELVGADLRSGPGTVEDRRTAIDLPLVRDGQLFRAQGRANGAGHRFALLGFDYSDYYSQGLS